MIEQITPVERQLITVETLVELKPEIAGFQLYEYFGNDAKEHRQAFIDGEHLRPIQAYPDLLQRTVLSLAEPTKLALRTLMSGETEEKKEALYRSIEYRYSEMCLMGLALEIKHSRGLHNKRREENIEWFKATNEALYGTPEAEIFSAIAMHEVVPHLIDSPDDTPNIQATRKSLRESVGVIDESAYELPNPSTETLERLGAIVRERFEPIYEHIDQDKTYTPQEMREALDESLERMGGKELGWRAILKPGASALAVSAHQRAVEVGADREEIKGDLLRSRTIHELGVHAGRSIRAERAGWLSAAYGQDGYLDYEEGLATALESAYAGEFKKSGQGHYLNIGLALGLDNHAPRDFRDVYEIAWRLNYLKAANKSKGSDEERLQKAKTSAFNSCVRIFRGTPTNIPGLTYNKDLSYFRGQALVWPMLEAVEKSKDLDVFLCGKLDLTRADHQPIAEAIMETA